jgi:multiple sugar transport system ATP-binding protein
MKARPMSEVGLRQVSKRFGEIEAVRDLSFEVASGEFVVLLGPTGAGKTTTLRLVAGLELPDEGRVSVDGRDVTTESPAARDVAFVFQQYSLYPHLTVFDNLAFPLRAPGRRLSEMEIRKRVQEIAELLRIAGKLGNRATRLSGGEMQRVAIGRALVRRPAIYLMDEPLSSLDAKLRADLRLELKRIQADLGATVLYVTHDQIEAMTMASRIGVMREGTLIQIGTPREIYESPNDLYVAARLGSPRINLLPVELAAGERTPTHTKTIGVRTEHLLIARPTNAGLVGQVRRVEHLGDQNHVHIEYKGHSLITLADPHRPLAAGQEVGLSLLNPLYFDAAGRRIGVAAE